MRKMLPIATAAALVLAAMPAIADGGMDDAREAAKNRGGPTPGYSVGATRATPRTQTHGATTWMFGKPVVVPGSISNRDSYRSQPGNNSYTGTGDIGGRYGGPR